MFILVLFGHLVGVLILFAAFALEWLALRQLQRAPAFGGTPLWKEIIRLLPRFHRIAGVVILLTGAYMATKLGAWRSGWVPVSLAGLVVLAILGMAGGARMGALGRPHAGEADASQIVRDRVTAIWLVASLRFRVPATLGIVYVMIAKPDFGTSVTIVVVSALAGAATVVPAWRASSAAARPAAVRRQLRA